MTRSVYRYAGVQGLLFGVVAGIAAPMGLTSGRTFTPEFSGSVAIALRQFLPILPLATGVIFVFTVACGLLSIPFGRAGNELQGLVVAIVLVVLTATGGTVGLVAGAVTSTGVGGDAGLAEKHVLATALNADFAYDYEQRGENKAIVTIRMTAGDTISRASTGSEGSVRVRGTGFANVSGAELTAPGDWKTFDDPTTTLETGDVITVGVTDDCSLEVLVWSRSLNVGDRLDSWDCPEAPALKRGSAGVSGGPPGTIPGTKPLVGHGGGR